MKASWYKFQNVMVKYNRHHNTKQQEAYLTL